MSKQILSLQNDWEEIKRGFQRHFQQQNIEIEEDKITYRKNGEHLEINRDGRVLAGRPLHTNEIEKAQEIVLTNSQVKIISENSNYTFRR